MKTILTCILSIFLSFNLASGADLNNALEKREKMKSDFLKLQDSVIINKLNKAVLLNEKLLLLNAYDDTLVNNAIQNLTELNDSIAQLSASIAGLKLENEKLQQRTVNDLKMILVLKVAAAFLIVVVLVLLYFLIFRKPTGIKFEEQANDQVSELTVLNEGYLREIDRLKSREHYIKEEMETEVKRYQDSYKHLSEKYNLLESEFNEFKNNRQVSENDFDKENLINQVTNLKKQLDESKAKNQAILRKIDKLISDLSGVTS